MTWPDTDFTIPDFLRVIWAAMKGGGQ